MKTNYPIAKETVEHPVVPADLRQWVSQEQLTAWIDDGLETLTWDGPAMQELLGAYPELRPRELLRLLALALAFGYQDSERILCGCATDPDLSEAWHGTPPRLEELALFRRKNTDLLEAMMLHLMKRAVQAHCECSLLPLDLKRYLANTAAVRVQAATLADFSLLAA